LNGNRPQIMRGVTFDKLLEHHSTEKRYFLGKYLMLKIKKKISERKSKPQANISATKLNDVDLFLHVLKQNPDMLSSVAIIVFEMNGRNQSNTFTEELKQKAMSSGNPAFIQNLIVVDMSQYLRENNFFMLDDHLNPSGHRIVADILYKTIKNTGISK